MNINLRKCSIRPEIIADPTISPGKKKQLAYIKSRLKAIFEDIHFVDDHVGRFPKLVKFGVHCYLAAWGYDTKKQHKEARRLGAMILTQNNFYNTLS